MKIVYSLNKLSNYNDYTEKHNLMFFVLSYFLTKNNISEDITICTDGFYKSVLKKLEFTNVVKFINKPNLKFQAKHEVIYYNLCKKDPFIFIDNDVFCFKNFDFNSNIICYAIEPFNFFESCLSYAKKLLNIDYKNSYNTGILGFKNIDQKIIDYYKTYVVDMYSRKDIHNFDMVAFDQYLFMNKILLDKIVDKVDVIYDKDWNSKEVIKEKQICHLIGSSKKNPKLVYFVEQHLKKLCPELLTKIKNLDI